MDEDDDAKLEAQFMTLKESTPDVTWHLETELEFFYFCQRKDLIDLKAAYDAWRHALRGLQ